MKDVLYIGMDYALNLSEHLGISDYNRVETELDAVIYRNEYVKFRNRYFNSEKETDLIFTFVVLQIYVECFLHQNMRRIIELEFKPPRLAVRDEWINKEWRKIPDKIDCFVALFEISQIVQPLANTIKSGFKDISDIRNKFAHGRKISTWADSSGGSGTTEARSMLTRHQLEQTEKEVNKLGIIWNEILDQVQKRCQALKRVDDFKFEKI